ncbi:carbohydrate ABC transporter permease [Gracilibacillus massiliensis]|uniref:carbohydrate ABC transporter permease n=1 Tax=Gracilibacillus massiliensis TaxID=1564956 RepID=UPI00071DD77A|nr:carbohydrate ABC transporter permease [Gracilibacillus massiliensis]
MKKSNIILSLVMLPITIIMIIPFYYILVNTIKSPQEAAQNPLALPKEIYLDNYVEVFTQVPLLQSFWNTFFVTFFSILLMIIIGAMAAYPLVFNMNKWNKVIMMYLIAGFLIPFQTTLIPLFELMVNFQFVDKLYGLVFVYMIGTIFCFFLTMGYMRTIPKDLIEAATIDGCSVFGIFWKIILPLLQPIIVTIAVFQTMWVWNDFLAPNLFLNSPSKNTLVLEIFNARSQYTVDWPLFMTLSVIVLIPMVIFFLTMQKYIVKGLVGGAVKG